MRPSTSPRLLLLLLACAGVSALMLFPRIVANNGMYAQVDRLPSVTYSGVLKAYTPAYPKVNNFGLAEVATDSGELRRIICVRKLKLTTGLPECLEFLNQFNGQVVQVAVTPRSAAFSTAVLGIVSAKDEAGVEVLSSAHLKQMFWPEMTLAIKVWAAMMGLLALTLLYVNRELKRKKSVDGQ